MSHEDVLTQMSLEEKVSLLAGGDFWHVPGIERLGIAPWRVTDGPIGARGATTTGGEMSAAFPCGTALAATWDPALVRDVGQSLGEEARAKGARLLLAPTVNLHRHPLAGRNFECFSEDPLLTGIMASAYIQGVQTTGVGACIKHFACNESEFERFTISSEVDEQTLREVYLRPFEIALEASRPVAVMAAYNRLNGTFCSESRWLLTEVLRRDWGYDGLVLSDWFGTHSTTDALDAGLDVEMPGPPRFRGALLVDAVRQGAASEHDVDRSVGRVLDALSRTGGLQVQPREAATADTGERRDLARRAARDAIVLLRNAPVAGEPVLPLSPGTRVALLGPCAAAPSPMGGGSAQVSPYYVRTPLAELTRRLPGVVHEPGCRISDRPQLLPRDWVTAPDGRPGLAVRVVTGTDPEGEDLVFERLLTVPLVTGEELPEGAVSARITGTLVVPEDGEYDLEVTTNAQPTLLLDEQQVPLGVGADEGSHVGAMRLPSGVAVTLRLDLTPPPGGFGDERLQAALRVQRHLDRSDLERAVAAAAAADVAVVVVGTSTDTESEGFDRSSLALPGDQDQLVRAVAAVNPRTVVVVNAGAPVAMDWVDEVAGVLQSWFGGQELGSALVDVLLGDVDATGRLPVTMPRRLEDTPAYETYPGADGKVVYREAGLVGYPWYVARDTEPLFPFGHGLSYTSFSYGAPRYDVDGRSLHVEVTNTGTRAGSTVVQVYADDPSRRLVGFAKQQLEAGATARLEVALPDAFSRWDPTARRWVTRPGAHRLVVGTSATHVIWSAEVELS